MNLSLGGSSANRRGKLRASLLSRVIFLAVASVVALPVARADDQSASTGQKPFYSSKKGIVRQYTQQDRVRYQLWDYTWKPDPTQPITRVEVRIGEQRVYVYQGDEIAGESPITTGKPGHDTPPGHYSVLVKDIDHKSNLYGVFLDANGYVIDGNAQAGQTPPAGAVYDSADMPYYLAHPGRWRGPARGLSSRLSGVARMHPHAARLRGIALLQRLCRHAGGCRPVVSAFVAAAVRRWSVTPGKKITAVAQLYKSCPTACSCWYCSSA